MFLLENYFVNLYNLHCRPRKPTFLTKTGFLHEKFLKNQIQVVLKGFFRDLILDIVIERLAIQN